jgi:hypothetical protein
MEDCYLIVIIREHNGFIRILNCKVNLGLLIMLMKVWKINCFYAKIKIIGMTLLTVH